MCIVWYNWVVVCCGGWLGCVLFVVRCINKFEFIGLVIIVCCVWGVIML